MKHKYLLRSVVCISYVLTKCVICLCGVWTKVSVCKPKLSVCITKLNNYQKSSQTYSQQTKTNQVDNVHKD